MIDDFCISNDKVEFVIVMTIGVGDNTKKN
jgi:hypothetical protein